MNSFNLVLRLVIQSCPALCNSIDCSPPGSSVHRIAIYLKTKKIILETLFEITSGGETFKTIFRFLFSISSHVYKGHNRKQFIRTVLT